MPTRHRPAWWLRLTRNAVLWFLPVTLVWVLLTPFYNRFLAAAGENLIRLGERPSVTRLLPKGTHHLVVTRSDLARSRGLLYTVRATDLHFNLLLLGSLFLAVPVVPWRQRLARLGWASLCAVFAHLLTLVFWVQFVYATQLGEWSLAHYGPFARNFWGLGKHLLDLPLKLALPLILWAAFYLEDLRRRPQSG